MARNAVVAGLDIGTTKILGVLAAKRPGSHLELVEAGEAPAVGIKKLTTVDSEGLSKSVVQTVRILREAGGSDLCLARIGYISNLPISTNPLEWGCDQNLLAALEQAGVDPEVLMPAPVAAGEAVLTVTEKELGVVLVDIGGSATGIALYDRGQLKHCSFLPVGGDHITSDLAIGLRTTMAEAERIKITQGLLAPVPGKYWTVTHLNGRETHRVTQNAVTDVVKPRVTEILELVHRIMDMNDAVGLLAAGIVFTGGSALLSGLIDYAADYLGIPVRIGLPAQVKGLEILSNLPAASTAVGLVRLDQAGEIVSSRNSSNWLTNKINALQTWRRRS